MQNSNGEDFNVLAIAPVSKGVAFAFMRDRHTLLEFGAKPVKKDYKNKASLQKVEKLMDRYEPELVVLPDVFEKGSRRKDRIRKLVKRLVFVVQRRGVSARLISKQELWDHFFDGKRGTKYGIALSVAKRFPDQLGDLLPPERQHWMSESHFTQLFDAAALALASFGQNIDKVAIQP